MICKPKFRKGDRVYDKYWPWDKGTVQHVMKTLVGVRFESGKVWVYDRAHQKYLVKQ